MKHLIYTCAAIMFSALTAFAGNAYSGPLSARSEEDLRDQLGEEIKDVLEIPYLRYSTEDLDGEVIIEATVTEEGKIFFKGLNGVNEDLRTNVYWKLNSLNLWTNPDLTNKLFRYKIKYSN